MVVGSVQSACYVHNSRLVGRCQEVAAWPGGRDLVACLVSMLAYSTIHEVIRG